jgi:CubicO group peptidase (beta-lactamase class C family)
MSKASFESARPDIERLVALRSQEERCSVAWGVVAGGELVMSGGHVAEPDAMPTEQTVFRIASMTKSFTAVALLMLRDRGVLRHDDVVADLAPEFASVVGPTTDSASITVRHLLTMAGGMATDDVWADRHLDISDDGLDSLLSEGLSFAWAPGVGGEYSNLGYAMLGRIIHRLSGRRPQDFISEEILQSLGMTRTTWLQPDHDDWARPFKVEDGQRIADAKPLGDGAIAPMGGLWSCLADLTRWVAFFADAFPPRDDPDDGPLCRASRREMQQVSRAWPTTHTLPTGEGDAAIPERIDGGGYGYGLFVMHDARFHHFVYHSGGLPGYGSNMRWLPSCGVGVITLGNATYVPMSPLARRILEIADDHGLVPRTSPEPAAAFVHAAGRLASLLSDWTDIAADELFTDNVALDESYTRRSARAAAAVAEHGLLSLASVTAESATRGQAVMRHADGTDLRIDIDVSPLVPPQVQFYEVVTG